jgi:AcrR family transcriptional regulator
MAVSKTRAKLVDIARQLFARNGVNETTMNDIAVASQKGRRTLYTYFKSKEEIYMAVVESELEMLSEALEKVASEKIAPDLKILKMIETHLDTIKLIVRRNGTLRASFFRDIWRVERVRRKFNLNEINLFRQILIEGKEQGLFNVDNVDILANILHYCIKGIEVPYIRGKIGEDLEDQKGWEYVARIVYGALGRQIPENENKLIHK